MTKDAIFISLGLAGTAGLVYCWRLITGKTADSGSVAPTVSPVTRSAPWPLSTGAAGTSVNVPSSPPPTFEAQKLTFEALSALWTENEMRKISFAELAKNWRNVEPTQQDAPKKEAVFRNADTRRFYETHVKGRPFIVGTVYDAVLEVLYLLDEFGDCSSVVKGNKDEPEGKNPVTTYEMLQQVNLRSHSFHVAEEAIRNAAGPIVPKVVVTALAHDLGKIPQYYERYYQTGTHAFAGVAVIETLESMRGLKYFKEVKEAIRLHHGSSDAYLDNILRESDHAARRREMAPIFERSDQKEKAPEPWQPVAQVPTSTVISPPAQKEEMQAPLKKGETDSLGNTAQSGDIMGAQEGKKAPCKYKTVDISPWFDPDQFLKDLAAVVNTKISYEGMQVKEKDQFWSALSLGSYVYFKKGAFWYMITRHSNGHADVQAAALIRQKADDIMYSVVRELAKRSNTIADEFMGDGYYGASFVANTNASIQLYLVPFRAEAFDVVLGGAAEARKTPVMKAVKEILPSRKIRGA